jgi:membrane protease YdiL (CAAX protease family)
MESFSLIEVVLVAIAAIALAVAWKRRRDGHASETDYRQQFRLGVVMLLGGALFTLGMFAVGAAWVASMPVFIMGIIYTSQGWEHRAEWRQP